MATGKTTAKNKRVLVVDDDTHVHDILRRMFERYAPTLDVSTVASGEEAVRLLEGGEPFDLIVSDVLRPGIDGHEFHRIVRESGSHAEVPFLFLTRVPLPPPTDPRDHVLPKPFSAKEVLERVRRLLGIGPRPDTRQLSAAELEDARRGTRVKTTQFVARRFGKVFEGHYVRFLQRTEHPVPIDLVQRHLLFARILSGYNLSEYLLKDAGEVSIEITDVPKMPGRHALNFFVLIRSENPRIPTERMLLPNMPEFLLARSTDELTLDDEIERTVDYLRAVYLDGDVAIPPEATVGSRIVFDRIEIDAVETAEGGGRRVDARVHLNIEPHRRTRLTDWANEGLAEVLDARSDPALLRRRLVEATLGLEELSSHFPERSGFTKAAAYLTATGLLVRHHHAETFEGPTCPRIEIEADRVSGADVLGGAKSLRIEDPIAKILHDDDLWSSVLTLWFFPDRAASQPGFALHGLRID